MGSRRRGSEERRRGAARQPSGRAPRRAEGRDRRAGGGSTRRVLDLQEAAGNAAVMRLLGLAQPKLVVGAASDSYEREADRIAHRVVQTLRGPDAAAEPAEDDPRTAPTGIARAAAVVGAEGGPADREVEAGIGAARGGGRALDPSTRTRMESAFSADFGAVRVHTGPRVDGLNESLQSRAFTLGSDIFVRGSDFRPGTGAGDELLAHELTHTIQQGGATVRRTVADAAMRVAGPDSDGIVG